MATTLYHANASGITLVTTAETVVATSPQIYADANNGRVKIYGHVNITEGAGGTAYVVRVRRGNSISGALVGVAETDTLAAASSETAPFSVEDAGWLNAAGGNQYCVTVQQTAATGNGTVNGADFQVDAIP